MERVIIIKNTATGQSLTMPVTPSGYPMSRGRGVERIDMAQTGQLALPGLNSLFTEPLSLMFPARLYPFCTAGAIADPQYYIEKLTAWSESGAVCRYIVAGGGVNVPVLLGPIDYEERDGTNDVYATLQLYEYRYLSEVVVEQTQNASRPVEHNTQSGAASNYTVAEGDTLWSICLEFYGDASLALRLAVANGIESPYILTPGQVLQLPTLEELMALDVPAGPPAAKEPTIIEAKVEMRGQLGLTANAKYIAAQVRK